MDKKGGNPDSFMENKRLKNYIEFWNLYIFNLYKKCLFLDISCTWYCQNREIKTYEPYYVADKIIADKEIEGKKTVKKNNNH